ncbi:hypothetical protein TIFTF001_032832 [Ficus carica]|uniref:Uncharacterized protein n=1 Tax=Ficus carica TaxID=3494 RepID=A0AA88DXY4_FICCA|nr:hypothetical protein TIFTF001_032832 [Ficus carica]
MFTKSYDKNKIKNEMMKIVLAERKLTSYVYAVELVSERFPAIRFHSLPAIATIIDLGSPQLQVLQLLREGLPPEIRRFIPAPMAGITDVPPQKIEADVGADDQDPANVITALEDQPEDPSVIVIDSNDDEEDIDEKFEEEWVKTVPLNSPEPDMANVVANLQRQLLEQQQETNRPRKQTTRMNQMPQVNEVPPQAHQLTELEKVLRASFALKKDARHWWMTVQMCRDVTTMSWQDFMFRTDIAKQVSAGSSPPTLVSNCVSRAIRAEYWINQEKEARAQIFKAKKEEKAVVKQVQPRQGT